MEKLELCSKSQNLLELVRNSKCSQELLLLIINKCNFCFAPFRVEGHEKGCKVEDGSN